MEVLSNSYVVFDTLEPTEKIVLTEYEDAKYSTNWCCGSRMGRNTFRVLFAGGLSFGGASFAGLIPTNGAYLLGGFISGVGNGFSTYLAWEKKKSFFIEKRLMTDLPKVEGKLNLLDVKVTALFEAIFLASLNGEEANAFCEILDTIKENTFVEEKEKNICFIWRHRHVRNSVRVLTAGGFSGLGGALGGFFPTRPWVLTGAFLGGFGNALSTWLAYETQYQKMIKRRAIKELPKLLKVIEKSEEELSLIVERLKMLKPEFLLKFNPTVAPSPNLDEIDKEASICDLYGMRALRNFVYVNIATWISAGGGWVASFYPQIPGIICGSIMGAAANSLSTIFAWENKADRKIEKAGTVKFDKLIVKVNDVSHKILALKAYVEGVMEAEISQKV